jgi:hypothetical protein
MERANHDGKLPELHDNVADSMISLSRQTLSKLDQKWRLSQLQLLDGWKYGPTVILPISEHERTEIGQGTAISPTSAIWAATSSFKNISGHKAK